MGQFTADERSQMLAEYFDRLRRFKSLSRAYQEAEDRLEASIEPELDATTERLRQLTNWYRANVPTLELSRCPFTGAVWRHSIDSHGLDGLWWDYDKPARPLDEPLGGKHLCFTGAMRLAEPVENTPFESRPGPEIPFVVPRLLDAPFTKAVLSQVPVGRHTGYLVVYYSTQIPPDVLRTADWGTEYANWPNAAGEWEASDFYDSEDTQDSNLVPWLQSGRLLWIAPGDDELRLREGVEGCPYVGLSGRVIPCRIKRGRVWWPEPDDQPGSGGAMSWSS